MIHRQPHNRGMGLIEIVIGSTIIVLGVLGLISSFGKYVSYAIANQKNVQAAYLAEEGLEGVTFLREKSWNTYIKAPALSTTTTYYLTWDSTNLFWKATTTAQYVDNDYLRSFTIADVKRDGTGKIASSGTYDPDTKQINLTVSYSQGHATTTKTMSTYIANIWGN
jgi:Tfp pilus assembly protein PilV